jgi:hypothetical protein
MSTKVIMEKYVDPRNPIVTIFINKFPISNTLIVLCATINVMTMETMAHLNICNLRPTPTLLELVNISKIKPEGVLEDTIASLDSWEYPMEFMVLQPRSNIGGDPLILGKPWLAPTYAFISCRYGNMSISHGNKIKQITLYPLAKTINELEHIPWLDDPNTHEEVIQKILTIEQ